MLRAFFIGLLLSPFVFIGLGVLGNNLWIFELVKWLGGGLLLMMLGLGLWNWRAPPGGGD
jgi:hypothetical protein